MSIIRLMKKIPVRSACFWLCLGFAILYASLGTRFISTLVYDYDGMMFQTDTAEAAEDITEFQTKNHGDTNVHPLFVLFINPIGSMLHMAFSTPVSIVITNSLFGMLLILFAYLFFCEIGLPRYQAFTWTMVTGFTASNLLFVSIPERHIFAAFSVTFMYYMIVKRPADTKGLIPAGLLSIGITITNFVQYMILFFTSLFHRQPTALPMTFKRKITTSIRFAILILGLAVLLSILQKWIWPDTRYFFQPKVYAEETEFIRLPADTAGMSAKLIELAANMFCYNITAPTTTINDDLKLAPIVLPIKSFSDYSFMGWIALSGWSLLILMSVILTMRKPGKWFWFQAGTILCLLFNVILHMIYGDDFFLYTVNWTFPVIALIAVATVDANRSTSIRLTLNALLTFFVGALIISNVMFINDVTYYFRYGNSDKWRKQNGPKWEQAKEMEKFLRKQNIRILFSIDSQKWLPYVMHKQIEVVNIPNERSPILKQKAELVSEGYAFLYDVGDMMDFVTNTMGSLEKKTYGDKDLYYNIIPPLADLASLSGKIKSIQSSCDQSHSVAAFDLNLDSDWTCGHEPGATNWLTVNFSEETYVSCVKLFSRDGKYPLGWQVEIKKTPGSSWEAITPEMKCQGYFWSGPRLFWNGRQLHAEARFMPVSATSLRMVFLPNEENRKTLISQVCIYGQGSPVPLESLSLPLLMNELESKKIKRLYSDRWTANAVYNWTNGRIETLLEPYVFQHERSRRQPDIEQQPYPIYLDKGTGILVRPEGLESTRFCLRERGFKMTETPVGSWVLFAVAENDWDKAYSGYSRLYWGGISCFLANRNGAAKMKAMELTRMSETAESEQEKMGLLDRALYFYPDLQHALFLKREIFEKNNDREKLSELETRINALCRPNTSLPAKFNNEIKLLGISLDKTKLSHGEEVNVRYYWKFKPAKGHHNRYAVFVHFQNNGTTIFQDDHDLGGQYSKDELMCQSPDEVTTEQLTVKIPGDAPEGDYSIYMGVYDRSSGKRLIPSVKSDVKKHKKGIVVPVVLEVKVPSPES